MRTSFKVKGQRSKVKVTRSTNAETGSALYLPNGKAYELLTCYTDRERRPVSRQIRWPPKSKVKVAGSGGPSGSCWPICLERRVPETPKLVGRLPTPTSNKSTRFKVKKLKVKVTRLINAETESVSHMNFKLSRRLEYALSTAMASYKGLWNLVIAREPCRPHPAATQLVNRKFHIFIPLMIVYFWCVVT